MSSQVYALVYHDTDHDIDDVYVFDNADAAKEQAQEIFDAENDDGEKVALNWANDDGDFFPDADTRQTLFDLDMWFNIYRRDVLTSAAPKL